MARVNWSRSRSPHPPSQADHEEEVAKTAASRQFNSCTSSSSYAGCCPPLFPSPGGDLRLQHVLAARLVERCKLVDTKMWIVKTPTIIWASAHSRWCIDSYFSSSYSPSWSITLVARGLPAESPNKTSDNCLWQFLPFAPPIVVFIISAAPLFAYADFDFGFGFWFLFRNGKGSDW